MFEGEGWISTIISPYPPFYRMLIVRGKGGVKEGQLPLVPSADPFRSRSKPVSIRTCAIAGRMQWARERLVAVLPTEDLYES